jgi:hypothetical protein
MGTTIGVLTNEGFRDVLEEGRYDRPAFHLWGPTERIYGFKYARSPVQTE